MPTSKEHRAGQGGTSPLLHVLFLGLLVTASLLPAPALAQNIKNKYVTSSQANGTLYFVFPLSGFAADGKGGRYRYDLTLLSAGDSVTINFSYVDPSTLVLDSLVLGDGNLRSAFPTKRLQVEPKGKGWHYRYTARVPMEWLAVWSERPHPPGLTLIANSGPIPLHISRGRWKDHSHLITRILQLVAYNK